MVHFIGVGEMSPCPAQHQDGGKIVIDKTRLDLFISLNAPTPSEIEAARFGRVTLGLATAKGIATGLLVWRFDHPLKPVLIDTPFNVCVDPRPEMWGLPDREPHEHLQTTIVLQDQYGIVRAIRTTTIPPKLMAPIEAVVESQADLTRADKWEPRMYAPEIDTLYRRWPAMKDAMRDAIRADLGQ